MIWLELHKIAFDNLSYYVFIVYAYVLLGLAFFSIMK